jgi:tetratricopeptide (TPR) repeat protein
VNAEQSLPDGDLKQRAEILARRGAIHSELWQLDLAERDLREALRLRKASEGAQSSGLTWYTQAQLAEVIGGRKTPSAFAEAEALFVEAADNVRRLLGPDAYQNALIATLRTRTYELYGKWPEAIREIREAIRLNEKAYGASGHFGQLTWGFTLVKLLVNVEGGVAEAERVADRLIEQWANNPKGVEEYMALALFRCELHERANEPASARELAQRVLAMRDPTPSVAQRERLEKFSQFAMR